MHAYLLTFACAVLGAIAPHSPQLAPQLAPAALEAPALQRVAVLGASASAGFGLAVDLPRAFAELIQVEHDEPLGLGDGMFFTRPRSSARSQVEQALVHRPSLVLGVDFLFWMAYGHMPDGQRAGLLEEGLTLLERFECPVVVATLPDMSGAIGRMLSEGQVPSPEVLASLNRRIHAWAAERGAVVVDLATLVARLEAGQPFEVAGMTWPPSAEVALLLPDRLHPTAAGLAAMVTVVAEGLVAHELVPRAALSLDVSQAHLAIQRLEAEAIARRQAERAARRAAR